MPTGWISHKPVIVHNCQCHYQCQYSIGLSIIFSVHFQECSLLKALGETVLLAYCQLPADRKHTFHVCFTCWRWQQASKAVSPRALRRDHSWKWTENIMDRPIEYWHWQWHWQLRIITGLSYCDAQLLTTKCLGLWPIQPVGIGIWTVTVTKWSLYVLSQCFFLFYMLLFSRIKLTPI